MPVNPGLAGRTYPPTAPYQVGREKVREFAKAVLSTDATNYDLEAARAAGHPDLVAPTTFPIVVANAAFETLLADPGAGIDFSRVVHGDQRFTYTRPIVAGDELTTTLTVSSVKTLAGNDLVTTESHIADAAGEHVVTSILSIVVRGDE